MGGAEGEGVGDERVRSKQINSYMHQDISFMWHIYMMNTILIEQLSGYTVLS